MTEDEKIWIASWAIGKGYDCETLGYSDYMNGKEEFLDDVWEYVIECREEGERAFREKYSSVKMY